MSGNKFWLAPGCSNHRTGTLVVGVGDQAAVTCITIQ